MNEHTISMSYMWFWGPSGLDRTLEEWKDAFMYHTCRLVWMVSPPLGRSLIFLPYFFSRNHRTLFDILSFLLPGVSFYVFMDYLFLWFGFFPWDNEIRTLWIHSPVRWVTQNHSLVVQFNCLPYRVLYKSGFDFLYESLVMYSYSKRRARVGWCKEMPCHANLWRGSNNLE